MAVKRQIGRWIDGYIDIDIDIDIDIVILYGERIDIARYR